MATQKRKKKIRQTCPKCGARPIIVGGVKVCVKCQPTGFEEQP